MSGRGGYPQFDDYNPYPPYSNQQNYNASFDSLAPNNPFSDRNAPYYASNNNAYTYSNLNTSQQYQQYPVQNYGVSSDSLVKPYGGQGTNPRQPAASGAKEQHSAWMEGGKEPQSPSSWKKWATIGALVLLVVAGVGGGIAGWKISQNNSSSSSSSSSSAADSTSNPETTSGLGSDPSVFEKDSRLVKSFYGIAYTPQNVQLPSCGATQENVTKEIQIISQLTTRIRTYGSDCNQSAMIMQAIQDTKVDLSVWLGIYVDDTTTYWNTAVNDTLNVIKTYGVDNIAGVTIGNEYILNKNATSASYTYIEKRVAEFKAELEDLNLSKTIPVGTADAGSVMTSALNAKVDYAMSNVHPWFGELHNGDALLLAGIGLTKCGVNIDDAAGWTWEYFTDNDVAVAGNATPYIAEVGWPTDAMTQSGLTYEGAVASVANLQTFLDTFVCQANANQTRYFYFECFDEPWKTIYGGVEPYWGLFDSNRIMKNVTIPDCVPTYD